MTTRTLNWAFLTILFTTLLFSCGEVKEALEANRKERFVDTFNEHATEFQSARIRKAEAHLDPTTQQVSVNFYLTPSDEEGIGDQLLQDMFPSLILFIFKELPGASSVLEDGNIIQTRIINGNDEVVYDIPVDQAQVADYEATVKAKQDLFVFCDVPDEVKTLIVTCNQGLPITDPTTGITVETITLDEQKRLVYTNITPEGVIDFSDPEVNKQNLVAMAQANPSLQGLKNMFLPEGVHVLSYKFVNESGEDLQQIDIDFNEF